MKKFIPLIIFPLLAACNSTANNNELCDCVAAGAEADSISAYYLTHEQTQEGKDALDKALKKRDEICAQFNFMLADELQEKAKDCDNLKFEP